MEPFSTGELVKVAGDGPERDGIVFDTPSKSKVVVAMVDPARGPVLRTVHPKLVSERSAEGSDDRALHLLILRTPSPPARGSAGAGMGAAGRGSAGHARGTMHRTTGK